MTVLLLPVSVLDDAVAKARAAARDLLPLISATLHHQFPTGAYLVLARLGVDEDIELDSVRDANGLVLHAFTPWPRVSQTLPAPPETVTALWGSLDPREPGAVRELIQRLDDVIDPFMLAEPLPDDLLTASEVKAEEETGCVLLGIPLGAPEPKRCAVCLTPVDEHAGRICERPATADC
ncbi:hypothetical protein [Streptomyces anulatus]|uniref:hypothetical protein n=1 Tax=Streptomyces anulatus TaxID=1892 RepID=UPI0037DDD2AA|nr:hypothetical protein OHB50_39520 [Streptomyces anulatus]